MAIAITRGKQDIPLLALGRRRKARSQRKEIESALEGAIGVDDMMKLGEQRGEARIEANPSLTGLAKELREHDQLALQYALLWRLDEQRRALQTIAAVVVAVAAFVGVDLADLHLTL